MGFSRVGMWRSFAAFFASETFVCGSRCLDLVSGFVRVLPFFAFGFLAQQQQHPEEQKGRQERSEEPERQQGQQEKKEGEGGEVEEVEEKEEEEEAAAAPAAKNSTTRRECNDLNKGSNENKHEHLMFCFAPHAALQCQQICTYRSDPFGSRVISPSNSSSSSYRDQMVPAIK